ncbi:MAG: regulatory protein [Bacillota bacterium]|nr:regulatory protein [Bacillota bacterium]MDK2855564.1 regulatory protein [Bacillota bacterium]MDK2925813.1 regulatory protein [Bacillota bacterium]
MTISMPPGDVYQSAWQYALSLLGRRAYSRAELLAKLEEKGFPGDVGRHVAARLVDYGYLADEEIARREAERCFLGKGLGPYRVELRLRQRGISPELIAGTLAKYRAAEKELCLKQARKKLAALPSGLAPAQVKARVGGYLARKGFSTATIEWCLEQVVGPEGVTGTP